MNFQQEGERPSNVAEYKNKITLHAVSSVGGGGGSSRSDDDDKDKKKYKPRRR
jgi:hypothetical protein